MIFSSWALGPKDPKMAHFGHIGLHSEFTTNLREKRGYRAESMEYTHLHHIPNTRTDTRRGAGAMEFTRLKCSRAHFGPKLSGYGPI